MVVGPVIFAVVREKIGGVYHTTVSRNDVYIVVETNMNHGVCETMVGIIFCTKMIRSFLAKKDQYCPHLQRYCFVVYSTNKLSVVECRTKRKYLSYIVVPKQHCWR